jgi:hypothetical protein
MQGNFLPSLIHQCLLSPYISSIPLSIAGLLHPRPLFNQNKMKMKISSHSFVCLKRELKLVTYIFAPYVLNVHYLNDVLATRMYCTRTSTQQCVAKRAACSLVMDDARGATVPAADPMISRAWTQHNHPPRSY